MSAAMHMRTMTVVLVLAVLSGCVHRRLAAPLQPPPAGGEEPPPGMVEVDIVSEYEDQVWDVYAGKDIICTTPCTQWVKAGQPLQLVSRDDDSLFVPGLGFEAFEARRAVLVAEGTCHGKHINGIVFTSLGGMGVVTAISLTAVGCSDISRRGGVCTAGLITGAVTVPLTALAIWMLVDGLPKAHIFPVPRAQATAGQPAVNVAVGPNGIYGTF